MLWSGHLLTLFLLILTALLPQIYTYSIASFLSIYPNRLSLALGPFIYCSYWNIPIWLTHTLYNLSISFSRKLLLIPQHVLFPYEVIYHTICVYLLNYYMLSKGVDISLFSVIPVSHITIILIFWMDDRSIGSGSCALRELPLSEWNLAILGNELVIWRLTKRKPHTSKRYLRFWVAMGKSVLRPSGKVTEQMKWALISEMTLASLLWSGYVCKGSHPHWYWCYV